MWPVYLRNKTTMLRSKPVFNSGDHFFATLIRLDKSKGPNNQSPLLSVKEIGKLEPTNWSKISLEFHVIYVTSRDLPMLITDDMVEISWPKIVLFNSYFLWAKVTFSPPKPH